MTALLRLALAAKSTPIFTVCRLLAISSALDLGEANWTSSVVLPSSISVNSMSKLELSFYTLLIRLTVCDWNSGSETDCSRDFNGEVRSWASSTYRWYSLVYLGTVLLARLFT